MTRLAGLKKSAAHHLRGQAMEKPSVNLGPPHEAFENIGHHFQPNGLESTAGSQRELGNK
jgi:hypothetical protein